MSRFETEARKVVETLDLRWAPIGGMFSAKADETGDSARKLSICEAFDVVKREGVVLNLSAKNCTCPGGRHFTGLEILPVETIATAVTKKRHRVYKSIGTAIASINKQPQPVKRGDFFILGPLEKFTKKPDVVFLLVNPAQADRILGLVSYRGAEPFTYYPASSICSTITNVMAKERPEINLISAFERREAKWTPDELMVGMPLKDFEAAVENIPKSGYGLTETS